MDFTLRKEQQDLRVVPKSSVGRSPTTPVNGMSPTKPCTARFSIMLVQTAFRCLVG